MSSKCFMHMIFCLGLDCYQRSSQKSLHVDILVQRFQLRAPLPSLRSDAGLLRRTQLRNHMYCPLGHLLHIYLLDDVPLSLPS
ncbi:hypothetical protein [Acinetobacter baumannii]|uniref:hypothetical protein n=1 Tax=Acinetobacter baumannii TaxID=470 RepID=UPI001178118A